MANLLERFKSDETETDADKAHFAMLRDCAQYPDVIGRSPDDIKPAWDGAKLERTHWMHCKCGMMVLTSTELAGQDATCENCHMNAGRPRAYSTEPQMRAMTKRGESRVLFAVAMFVLIAGGTIGSRMWDAPPRAQAASERVLD